VLPGALLASLAFSAPAGADLPKVGNDAKPAAERSIDAGPIAKPTGTKYVSGQTRGGTGGRPALRATKLPEAVQAQLKAQLDARVDRDLLQVRGLRGEALGLLSKFVAETPRESPEMPEALMRLAELKWEQEREAFVERFKAWEKRPTDQRGATPEPDFRPSRDLLTRVLRDYPWFSEYDLALYVDGFLATEQGKQEEALERFERILREYPQSRFTPDAHMAKAESLFSNKYDYAGALAEYEQVLKFKDSDLYGLALFKSAWCYWRLGRNDEAAKRFVSVFEVTDTSGRRVTAQQQRQLDELQGEALKYLVEVFTEDEKNTAQDLYNFLTKIGGDRFAGKIVKALAEQFYDQAHYERGVEAYELLLKLEPTHREAGLWVLQICEGYWALEDYPRLRTCYERAATGYTAGGPWARTQADPANVQATTAKIEVSLREHATALHAKAQKDKTSRAEFEGAAGLYGVYIAHFPSAPGAFRVQYNLAEIEFFHLGKPTDAATHYLAAAKQIPDKERSGELATLRHDALYNALVALSRVRAEQFEARKGKQAPAGETDADKKFAEALETYAHYYPNDPELPGMFYAHGRTYFDNGSYDSAVKIWGMLLEKFPSSPAARDAGESILESFNRAKNYENIETWARRLKAAPAFQTPAQQQKLDALIVVAVFKQGEQKAAANEHGAAAAAYLRAAKEFPKDPRAAQACVNAEQEAKLAGDVPTLKEAARLAMGPDYRGRPESPQGAWIAASTLQAMGLFGDAAEIDEQMASFADREHPNYQKYEHTKDAAYNAVILREAIGEHDKAVAAGNRYLAVYGSSPEADEIYFQMGRAHQNAGRPKDAAELYKRHLARSKSQDRRAQGFVLLALAQLKMNDERGAEQSLASAVEIGKRRKGELGPEGKYAAARARYMEGERVLAKFEQIHIEGDVKQLSARLKQKSQLLKQSAQIFLDVVSMGVAEWSTAALYQIGHTYESFAKAMRDAAPPGNLSDAEKEDYKAQIEPFAVEFEERSLDAYENGWKKAIELGIYNQWTAKMRDALGRLNAELYPPFKETGFEVRTQGPMPMPPLLDAPRRGAPTKSGKVPPPATAKR
jgi:tetratricopeptide (TPR) repeat protein